MARGRMISKSLSTSERRAALHTVVPKLAEFCQQLYPLLVAHADDFGRLSGDAFTVKHAVDPTSPRPLHDFERALAALDQVGLVVCYEAEGRQLIEIANFELHQQGLHKRTKSLYSGPFPGTSGKVREIPGQEKRTEQNGTELKGSEQEAKGTETHARAGAAPLVDRTHRTHALCGRVCLPSGLFQEFLRRRNHPQADTEIRRWAAGVIDAWTTGAHAQEEPGDVFGFWRRQYDDRWPAPQAGPKSRAPKWLQDVERRQRGHV